ncbi:histone-lysine N-methyltransferase 2D isoform X1 [Oncorhynchus mykiss]|uniref:UBA domain-containing protein n=1 Tax=Oncorhynchus mykiss TaxID=8022 RepID=A0A8C7PG06_ONCMY|nr:histone-lysine N-methyltransferase 2D isoform X1 [Oncorhynchus mykiss]
MLVTVFCAPNDRSEITFSLDVSPEIELRDFVALCELESGIPAGEIQITYAEQPLKDLTRALGTYGLKDGDVVVLRQADRRPPPAQSAFPGLPRIDFSSIAVPGTSSGSSQRFTRRQQQQAPTSQQQRSPPPAAPPSLPGSASSPQGLDDPALLQQMLLANPHELSLLKERNPPLAEALLSGDLERFTKVLLEQQQDRARREQERIRLLTADPFDMEAQAKIEEDIRQHNVEENMTIAMEEAPESFGQVVMLYINCIVNGYHVKAFVDSGAQMTIMSQACAKRCNIMRLVDRRWAGIAKGVGTQKIIGRVHLAQVQIEGDFLPCSFSILEDQPMDMLLGLDMLKRHQCSIDLKKNTLLIGTTGTETRFLPEAELPECARLAYGPEGREDAQPDEIADRELAEALQRSVQESGGQTTSPESPPFPTLKPPNNMPLSSPLSPGHPRSLALDRSQSAPAYMRQAGAPTPGQSQTQPGFLGLPIPGPSSQNIAPTAQQSPLSDPSPTNPTQRLLPTIPTPPAQDLSTCTPPADKSVTGTPTLGCSDSQIPPEMCVSEKANNGSLSPLPEESLPIQPMEQEDMSVNTTDHRTCLSNPSQQSGEGGSHRPISNPPSLTLEPCLSGSTSAEMESPPASSQSTVQSERDQPEGERCPNSDQIPSLAQALRELHELLVSNSCGLSPQDRSVSCSPSHRQDADGLNDNHNPTAEPQTLTPENTTQPSPFTALIAGAEPCDAKANHAAAMSDGGPPPDCVLPGTSGQEQSLETRDRAEAEPGAGQGELEPQCPDNSRGGKRADGYGLDASKNRGTVSEVQSPSPSSLQADLEFREPPEGQQGRGVADGRASAIDNPDTPGLHPEPTQRSPLSMAVGSPEDDSGLSPRTSPPQALGPQHPSSPAPLFSAPHPVTEQFPVEHIQRIQTAGFSAREAAEALEQAQGCVELALLALLARKITVPT